MRSKFLGKRLFSYTAESYEKVIINSIIDAMQDGEVLKKMSENQILKIEEILEEGDVNLVELVGSLPSFFEGDSILNEYNILCNFEEIERLNEQRYTLTKICLEKFEDLKIYFLNQIGEEETESIKIDLKEQERLMVEMNNQLPKGKEFKDLREFILYEAYGTYEINGEFYDFSLL